MKVKRGINGIIQSKQTLKIQIHLVHFCYPTHPFLLPCMLSNVDNVITLVFQLHENQYE